MGERKDFNLKAESFFKRIEAFFNICIVAILLVACAYLIFIIAIDFVRPTPTPKIIMHVINETLLVLIILEIVWTILQFIRENRIFLGPFIIIGIISAIRRLLFIEARSSYEKHLSMEELYEVIVTAFIVLILIISYYLAMKARRIESELEDKGQSFKF